MEFFKIRRTIPFMRHALVFNIISLVTFLLAVFFLATKGLHFSVEFTGGTVIEVQYEQSADLEPIRNAVTGIGYGEVNVQNFGSSKDVMIRLPLIKNADGTMMSSSDQSKTVFTKLQESHPQVKLQRVEYVGPQVGEELLYGGIKALLFVVIGIVILTVFVIAVLSPLLSVLLLLSSALSLSLPVVLPLLLLLSVLLLLSLAL